MKMKNKFLASFLAVVMGLGILGLPALNLFNTLAVSAQISTETLEIVNVNKSYDITTNNVLTFKDYCPDESAQFAIYNPDGSILGSYSMFGGYGTAGLPSTVTFRTPGLYALQFKRMSTEGFYIYSDIIYIPVSSGSLENITLDGELYDRVSPGTTVVCPMPITSGWEEDASVTVKVYTPYGEEVRAIKYSDTNKWTFTNKENVLGRYFVEYTKNVIVGGINKTLFKYETIEFSQDSSSFTSTKNYSKPELSEGKLNIVVSGTDIFAEKDNILLFKNYDYKNVYVQNKDGSTVAGAEIMVAVLDKDANKYYDFSTGKFELDEVEVARKNITDPILPEKFCLTNPENLKNSSGMLSMSATGHNIEFIYSSTVVQTNLTQTISRVEKFKFDDISIVTKGLLSSEITDIVLGGDTKVYNNSYVTMPGIKLVVNGDYNLEALKTMAKKTRVTITPQNGGVEKTSNAGIDSNGLGVKTYNEESPFLTTFEYHYNRNVEKEQTIRVTYALDFEYPGTDFSGSKTYSINMFTRETSKDSTAPANLTIDSYSSVSLDGKFIVPKATANDKDNLGNVTTGANILATISGVAYGNVATPVEMGQELNLDNGNYEIRFVVTDAVGNRRVKTIGFKVSMPDVNTSPTTNVSSADVEIVNGKLTAVINTNATKVLIFGGEKGQFTPTKVDYINGMIAEFEFDVDNNEGYVAVFANSTKHSTIYKAVKLTDGTVNEKIRSFGYSKLNDGYTLINPNTTMDVNLLDKLVWFGGKDFEIEAPENAYYKVSEENIICFYTSGTYKIKSTEKIELNNKVTYLDATTTINVKVSVSSVSATQPFGNKLIAQKGEKVVLNMPVAVNFYGYNFDLVVKNSSGNIIATYNPEMLAVKAPLSKTGDEISFVAPAQDEYSFEYTFRTEDFGKNLVTVPVTTGNVANPRITLLGENKNKVYEGERIKYIIQNATATDKNGKSLAVNAQVFNQYGNLVEIKTEGETRYVELESAGFYTIYYSAVDEFGKETIVTSIFAIEFPEEEEDGLSAWAIIGIVIASIVGAGAIAFATYYVIKNVKKKTKFINKNKQAKKQEKQEKEESVKVYTIAQSKDEKHWIVKLGSRTISKENSKGDAVMKAKEAHKKGEQVIKVYNKNGRLIDSI